jgi:hypothetical protein
MSINKISYPGYIDRQGVGADALDKEIDAMRFRFNKVPMQMAELFRVAKSRANSYYESTFGDELDLPRESSDVDKIPMLTPTNGFKKQFTVTQYRAGVQVERAMPESELIPVARRMIGGLMTSMRRQKEYAMADIWNNLTATGDYLGADAKAIAADDHPYPDSLIGTWSNLDAVASDLTYDAYNTNRKALRKRKNAKGQVMGINPKLLIVPIDKEKEARTVIGTELVPGSANNDLNVFQNTVTIKVVDYLTSTTQWTLKGDVGDEYCGFLWIEDQPASIIPTTGADRSTDVIWGERGRARFAVGATVDNNIQHNTGA